MSVSLELLSGKEDVSSGANPDNAISQLITNILSTSYNDPSLRQALSVLDTKMEENTAENRRQLRSNIETSVLKSGSTILKDFTKLHQKLSSLGDSIQELNNQYNHMEKVVSQATKDTLLIQKQAEELRSSEETISIKKRLLEAYENNFVLTDQELDILNNGLLASGADEVEQFFQVLQKVNHIHNDCQVLLSADDTSQTGMEIMGQMSAHLDKGYERILIAVENEFKKMVSGQYLQISKSLRRYLTILSSERPNLFDSALNGLIDTRQKNLTNEFIKALTVETSTSKPIDFYAYDILRYVGDIMAWIHSAIVGEQEILETLLLDDKKTLLQKIDKATTSLVKPLRLRIEQVISTEDNLVDIYKVGNVLNFYYSIFIKIFSNESSAIMTAISRLEEACSRQFSQCLQNKIASQKDGLGAVTRPGSSLLRDLQPPEFFSDALADAKAILSSYEASINFTSPPSNQFKQTLHDLIEPYLELCNRVSESLPSVDSEIFVINCFDATKSTLSLFPFVQYKIDQMNNRTDELAEVLEDSQYYKFLSSSGVNSILNADKTLNREKISGNTQLIQELAASLDNFLPAANMESSVLLHRLSSPRLSSSITLRASQRFVDIFQQIKQCLDELYGEEAAVLMPRSVSEVKTLLAIE
ncbi:Cog6p [Sugiyamaella lignohabitans]|uniref:Conserved oligomeric Golgi complex subunit 6 n=1 Tax=Sugiyamaella lignohabitans TaxID=796027 RepID=A0A167EXA4_9ASCO|nr:Cog6p [Sugiyamaella lignohabitans]ANB14565.1 Cog6p [Sugiyamaella lignohabitans]